MIYIKFGEAGTKYANVGVTITNSIPEGEDPTQFCYYKVNKTL